MPVVVTVCFATNRQPLTDGGDRMVGLASGLGPLGGLDVRYGQAQVEVDLDKNAATLIPGSLEVADRKLLFPPPVSAPMLGSKTIFDAIRAEMAKSNRPTIVVSDKVAAIDVSDVITLEEEPEKYYYRVFPAVRDDIVAVLRGTPQNQVPNRIAVPEGRWRIAPAAALSQRTTREQRRRRTACGSAQLSCRTIPECLQI